MTLLVILHVLISVFLIFVVLIQGGKGAEMGAAFGGASQTVFGSRGAATFLNKLTTYVAVAFMATSLILAISSSRATSIIKGGSGGGAPMSAPAGMPAMPAAPGAPATLPSGMPLPGSTQGGAQAPAAPQGTAPAKAAPAAPTAPAAQQQPTTKK